MREFDEDAYRDSQLNRHLEEQEMNQLVSKCCGELIYDGDNDICLSCREHCTFLTLGEYEYNEYENAMCDKADAQRELET